MPQDAFTIFHTAKELNSILSGARVDRVNQPEKDSVVLNLHKDKNDYFLTACAKAEFSRLSVGKVKPTAPIDAPSFCMLLRKHLSRAIIKNVSAVRDERIIRVTFFCRDELGETSEKILYCEIMGKYSNVVLTEKGITLGAMKTTSLDNDYPRKIFSGLEYTLPKKQDKISVFDEIEAKNVLSHFNGSNLSNFIFNNALISSIV